MVTSCSDFVPTQSIVNNLYTHSSYPSWATFKLVYTKETRVQTAVKIKGSNHEVVYMSADHFLPPLHYIATSISIYLSLNCAAGITSQHNNCPGCSQNIN